MFATRLQKFLVIVFLLLGALTLSIRVDIAPAAGVPPTSAGSVSVTDSGITPTSVTILAGGSVLWTNRGSRPHNIVSSRGAFDSFWLASAHSHRVPFPLPGVYPYTVDGVTKGVIVVIAGSAGVPAAGASASFTGPEDCGHPRIYHYDIEVAVHRDEAYTFTPWHTPGTVRRVYDWQAKWLHAPMSVSCVAVKFASCFPPVCRRVLRKKKAWPPASLLSRYPGTMRQNSSSGFRRILQLWFHSATLPTCLGRRPRRPLTVTGSRMATTPSSNFKRFGLTRKHTMT